MKQTIHMWDIAVIGELPAGPWELAASPWPRTGADRCNRRRAGVNGPDEGRLRRVLALPGATGERSPTAGLAVAEDLSLRVAWQGRLFGLDGDGGLRWELPPCGGVSPGYKASRAPKKAVGTVGHGAASAVPLALQDGTCIVAGSSTLRFVAPDGRVRAHLDLPGSLDDSGIAPNLAPDGTLLLTTPAGALLRLCGSRLTRLGTFGYDLVAPAIDDEGRMVVAGYYGTGLAQVDPAGAVLWRSGLHEADMLPTVDASGRAAGGSKNDGVSWIVDPMGCTLGVYPAPASFAVTEDGWIALSVDALAGLTPDGAVRWRREGGARVRWGRLGPAVDARGCVYAPDGARLVSVDPDGRTRFGVELPGVPIDIAIVAPGRVAVLLADGLYFVE
ncbi:MAG: hypothetical protein Q8P18_19825 [Pseudomonadota bacterium]|nr:hypothetical protein [Pseudomonadota bacterium]